MRTLRERVLLMALVSPVFLLIFLALQSQLQRNTTGLIVFSALPFVFQGRAHDYAPLPKCSQPMPSPLSTIDACDNPTRRRVYVSVSGDDESGDGSVNKPFATLHHALDSVADTVARASASDLTPHIRILFGSYHFDRSAIIDNRHSGRAGDPLLIEGHSLSEEDGGNDRPLLSGGYEIPHSCFRTVDKLPSEQSQSVPLSVRENVVAVNLIDCLNISLSSIPPLTPYGFSEPVLPTHAILYMDNTQLTLARYPNRGQWLRTGQVIDSGSVIRNGDFAKRSFKFATQPDTEVQPFQQLPNFDTGDNVWMFGYWQYDWAEQTTQIKSLTRSTGTNTLTVESSQASHYGIKSNARYYFYNLLAGLDEPGEYYVDRSNGWLYVYLPFQFITQSSIQASITEESVHRLDSKASIKHSPPSKLFLSFLDRPVIELRGAQHVLIQSLAVAHTRNSGIRMIESNNVSIDRLSIHSVGNAGIVCGHGAPVNHQYTGGVDSDYHDDSDVVIGDIGQSVYHKNFLDTMWDRQCGSCHSVTRTTIFNTGSGGMIMGGGDRTTLTPSLSVIANNYISHYSTVWHTYRPALWLDGVNVTVTNNYVSNGPHAAILLNGNNHRLANNDISHVCQHTADVGVIYTGRDFTQRGHTIANNFIHHISGLTHTITSDNKHSDVKRGNDANAIYFDDLSSGSTVINNLFYRVHRAVFVGGGRDHTITNNLMVECEVPIHVDARAIKSHKKLVSHDEVLYTRFYSTPIHSSVWREQYPMLETTWNASVGVPVNNHITGNAMVHCGPAKIARENRPAFSPTANSNIPTTLTVTDTDAEEEASAVIRIIDNNNHWRFAHNTTEAISSILSTLYSHDTARQLNSHFTHSHFTSDFCAGYYSFNTSNVVLNLALMAQLRSVDVSLIKLDEIGPCCQQR